jgi:hypothetical protein
VPDRAGLHLRPGLDAIRKHPVFILCIHPGLRGKQTLNVRFNQPDGAIGAVYLGVWNLPRLR